MTIHDPDAETDEWITHPPPSPAATLTDQQMLEASECTHRCTTERKP